MYFGLGSITFHIYLTKGMPNGGLKSETSWILKKVFLLRIGTSAMFTAHVYVVYVYAVNLQRLYVIIHRIYAYIHAVYTPYTYAVYTA